MSRRQTRLNLLVTGAGAPGIRGTLYALRKNPDHREVRIVCVDTDEDAVGRFLSDKFYSVPPPEQSEYIDSVCEICAKESISVVLPQTTREIVRLAQCREALNGRGIGVMVSRPEAIALANDKAKVMSVFGELGLPSPRFRVAATEDELVSAVFELGYPEKAVVIKPEISNGMRGVRIIRSNSWDVHRFLTEKPSGLEVSLEELLQILRRGSTWPKLVVMEYLEGPEYSVDAFIGTSFEIAIPRVREVIRSGITFRSRTELQQRISDLTLKVARHIGLQYAFGFQFKLDEGGTVKVLECNPRIQGTMVASVFSGANVIWFGVRELLGEPVSGLPHPLRPSRFVRFWGGLGVADGSADEI